MDVYLGMIICVGFNFIPRGFAPCDGRLLSIAQNTALFSLLGTQYGGDGITTFGLPDLRSRVAVGFSGSAPGLTAIAIGEKAGAQQTTLLSQNMPAHTHTALLSAVNADGSTSNPANALLATGNTPPSAPGEPATTVNNYVPAAGATTTPMAGSSVTVQPSGGNVPVSILNPYLGLNFVIATQGIYPSRD